MKAMIVIATSVIITIQARVMGPTLSSKKPTCTTDTHSMISTAAAGHHNINNGIHAERDMCMSNACKDNSFTDIPQKTTVPTAILLAEA